ncbi:DUF58 domain-containing protein [Georgenia subflava]|uniref:DUF58 domain-containing protein n=1 Tax=Georgenia subflava TaxID=1622177 RepID=A0A6N7EK12_9MICO|nr:DUF58 domain-containing protein [Georgenia subflava]MPV38489.1 DUF58 domain-containing protein [Georgenia subflava]
MNGAGTGAGARARTGAWRVSGASHAFVVVAVLLLLVGMVLGRPDVAVLGVPLLLTVVWGWAARPRAAVRTALHSASQEVAAGEVGADLVVEAPAGCEAMMLRVASPGLAPAEALVHLPAGERTLGLRSATVRTGAQQLFTVDHAGVGTGGVVRTGQATVGPVTTLVLPGVVPLGRLPLPRRLQGLTGAHDANRAGDGGELRDVALFAPGDRLRRIDWRTTARRTGASGGVVRDLYVHRTFATADATVMLVVDSRDEVGPDVGTWSGSRQVRPDDATSLDLAREAAASIARRYLAAGDRVGLADLGMRRRALPPAGGSRQLARLTHRLALAQPEPQAGRLVRAPLLPSGALVVLLSTFLDEEAAQIAHSWRRSGHQVVSVDVLPPLRESGVEPGQRTAFRLVRMERADRLELLRRGGVDVVRWRPADVPGAVPATAALGALALAGRRRAGAAAGSRR